VTPLCYQNAVTLMQCVWRHAEPGALVIDLDVEPVGEGGFEIVDPEADAGVDDDHHHSVMYEIYLIARGTSTAVVEGVKAYVRKAAEWVTRESMQIHGGMGYAEEYEISRLFVDSRVLSIFEGADETLRLKVIARQLITNSAA